MPHEASPAETDARTAALMGIFFMILTGLLFIGVNAIVHGIGTDVPALQASFTRYLIGVILVMPALLSLRHTHIPKAVWLRFGFRGAVHAVAVCLWFYAMARIPITEVIAIGYTTPVYVTIGAALFFGERLGPWRIGAITIAFLGAMLILRPGFEQISLGQIAQITAALLFAVSYILIKGFSGYATAAQIVAILTITTTVIMAPFALASWQPMAWAHIGLMGIVACLATLAHICMTRAMSLAPITVTQPVVFLQLVWGSLLGYFAFGEEIDRFVILGGAIIISAVVIIAFRESRHKTSPRTPPAGAAKL